MDTVRPCIGVYDSQGTIYKIQGCWLCSASIIQLFSINIIVRAYDILIAIIYTNNQPYTFAFSKSDISTGTFYCLTPAVPISR